MPTKFLLPFVYSFLLSVIAIFFLTKAKLSSKRKLSFRNRLGGVVVIVVFVLIALLDRNLVITRPIAGILIGGLMILLFGLWDDLKNLDWKLHLLFQIIVAVVAISLGVRSEFVTNPFGGIIFLANPIVYFLFFTIYFLIFLNSLNWLDGTDGLAGGVTIASLGAVFFLSFKPEVNQPAVAILCAIAGGSILGFLVFNFNPSKIIAGTSGAWFFGFVLASISIFAGAKIATVMMAVLIPILDLARVIWERWRSNQSIFQKDRRHLHYLLLDKGISQRKIFFIYFLASSLIGILALNLNAPGKLVTMGTVGIIYFWIIICKIKQRSK